LGIGEKMKLFEVMNTTIPYKWKQAPAPHHAMSAATFVVGDLTYHVTFQHQSIATDDGEEYQGAVLAFAAKDKHNDYHENITGSGNALRIFGTVYTILQDFIEHAQPDAIMFSADKDEPSRVSLYNRFAKRMVKQGWEHCKPELEDRYSDGTVLVRPGANS
jgi:hypothetical protein